MNKLITILLASALVLTGCKDDKSTQAVPTDASKSGAATTLNLWTFIAQHREYYDEMVTRWNKKNPTQQINLKVSVLPFEDMHNKLQVAIQSGSGGPDIADIEVKKFSNMLLGKIGLYPMTAYVEPLKNDLVMSRLNMYSKDGQYYGIDFHVGATVTYYNMDIMKKAGIDPDTIKTWKDYIKAGYLVKEKTGKPMVAFETSDAFTAWGVLIQSGADYLNAEGKPDVNNPKAVAIYKEMQQLIKDKVAVVAAGSYYHAEEFYGSMNHGDVASITMPLWYMGRFTDFMPDLKKKIYITKMPMVAGSSIQSVGLGGTGTSVLASSPHTKLAADFLAYAKLSEEGNIAIWKQLGFDPIRKSVWTSKEFNEPTKFNDYFINSPQKVLSSIQGDIPSSRLSVNLAKTIDQIHSNLFHDLFESGVDAQKAADDSQAQLIGN